MTAQKKIGTILKTKGFDGATLVSFDFPITSIEFKALFISKGSMHLPLLIENIQKMDDFTLLIKWKKYSSKEEAQLLHNKDVFLDESQIPLYFNIEELDDLIGYEVYSDEEKLGLVIGLYQTAQQETLEVNLSNAKKLLIPLIEEYVLTIDEDERKIYCELTPEFIDLFSH